MKRPLISLCQLLFARRLLYPLNTHLHHLVLRSLGILNSDTAEATGEPWLLKKLQASASSGVISMNVIVDVGANDYAYGQVEFPRAHIYAFEPHPESHLRLKSQASSNVIPIRAAVGDRGAAAVDFWDFADNAPRKREQPTSQLATLHKAAIEQLYHQPVKQYRVPMITLDAFAKRMNIERINLLKIDAEGNELAVLKGARQLLAKRRIDFIQFEFNEIHAYARVLFKDFSDLLPGFTFYRLLPKGIVPLGSYRPLTHELFGFQNILTVRDGLHFHL